MAVKRYPHSIRFSADEWRIVVEAAERHETTPGEFVRGAAARAAAQDLHLNDQQLTPELVDLIKRTFRGVHLLAFLKRLELSRDGAEDVFREAVEAARAAQAEALQPDERD